MLRKIFLIILFVMLLSTNPALAGQSSHHIINPDSISSAGDNSSSNNNQGIMSFGILSYGQMASVDYINLSGFLVSMSGSGDIIPPSISAIKINGQNIENDDNVTNACTLTANVRDNPGGVGVSVESCTILVDTTEYSFDNLPFPSTFDAATGNLMFSFNFSDGSHVFKITAKDKNKNTSYYQRTVNADAGDLKATICGIYPNPYNPSKGNALIGYQLNKDANVTLYMFNEINQQIWKRSYNNGTNGGRAGYNEIVWNGINDFSETVGNGAYFLRIASDGRMIGKVKIAVLR